MVNKKNTILKNGKTKGISKQKEITSVVESIEEKFNYRFKLGFDQSVSSGVISIHGDCFFNDDIKDQENTLHALRISLQKFEHDLTNHGYMVATKYAPKKNGNGVKNNE